MLSSADKLCCFVLHAGSDAARASALSGLDLQDSWAASGLASSITTAQLKPKLSMRPITTHVNVLLAGSGHYLGKAPYYSQDSGTASTAADSTARSAATSKDASSTHTKTQATNKTTAEGPPHAEKDSKVSPAASAGPDDSSSSTAGNTAPVDLHAAFLGDPAAWATQLPPVLLPEACREMVYKFQVRCLHQGGRLERAAGLL
jgi:hypothetical protein